MKDWRGAEVGVNDLVIWAGRRSSRIDLAEGKVLKIDGEAATVQVIRRNGHVWKDSRKTVTLGGTYLTVVYHLPAVEDDTA